MKKYLNIDLFAFFTAVVDLDEYILPAKSANLASFLDTKSSVEKNAAYFLFQNAQR